MKEKYVISPYDPKLEPKSPFSTPLPNHMPVSRGEVS